MRFGSVCSGIEAASVAEKQSKLRYMGIKS